ncbi:MAG: acyltransferase family protein [Clostridiales bacterium]|jgi:hypothetical protein|nr:acyltransferase family protein [Clostridiales bacterium]
MQTNDNDSNAKPQRNAVVELARFIFALWILVYHGFVPINLNGYLNNGYLGVEFFFILSGCLFVRSAKKHTAAYKERHANDSISGKPKALLKEIAITYPTFIWRKVKSMCPILIVGLAFSTWYSFIAGTGDIWGFLWFIRSLLIAYTLFFIIYRFVKAQRFWGVFAFAALIGYHVLDFYGLPGFELRTFSCVALGIFIAQLPKLSGFEKTKRFVFPLFLVVAASVTALMTVQKSNPDILNYLLILDLGLLVYFAFQIELKIPILPQIFIYLGSLSWGMYAFQNVVRVIRDFHSEAGTAWLFFAIIAMCIASSREPLFKRQNKIAAPL